MAPIRPVPRKADKTGGRRISVAITNAGQRLVTSTARHTAAILEAYTNAFRQMRLAKRLNELTAFREAIIPLHAG